MKELETGWVGDELSSTILLLNLAIGFLLSLGVVYHFHKYSSVLTNKANLSRVFPFIILTTILIISIVKSSLALSLGLVGALSIVRFRTPIKEPEELAYLFISIGIGLGLGANQTVNTIVAAVLILVLMAIFKKKSFDGKINYDYFLSINMSNKQEGDIEEITSIVSNYCNKVDMRRYQISDDQSNIVFYIDVAGVDNLNKIVTKLRDKYEGIDVSFIDQSTMPNI